jgi:lactate dehydrogenase-like 2-hydroxyacid dehydrogenase
VLNVPEALFKHDNIVLQTHISSGTVATCTAMRQLVVDNHAAWIARTPLRTPVSG